MNLKTWVKGIFTRKPEHDRELYVLNSGLAFVKCRRCGSESIPWRVNPTQAREYNERYPESLEDLLIIDKNKQINACRMEWR